MSTEPKVSDALRPFAVAADIWSEDDSTKAIGFDGNLMVCDLRAAASALPLAEKMEAEIERLNAVLSNNWLLADRGRFPQLIRFEVCQWREDGGCFPLGIFGNSEREAIDAALKAQEDSKR